MWSAVSGTQSFLILFYFHLSICQSVQVALYYSVMLETLCCVRTHTQREGKADIEAVIDSYIQIQALTAVILSDRAC